MSNTRLHSFRGPEPAAAADGGRDPRSSGDQGSRRGRRCGASRSVRKDESPVAAGAAAISGALVLVMFRGHRPQGGGHVPHADRVVRTGRGHRRQVRRQGDEVGPRACSGCPAVQLVAVVDPDDRGGRLPARTQIPPATRTPTKSSPFFGSPVHNSLMFGPPRGAEAGLAEVSVFPSAENASLREPSAARRSVPVFLPVRASQRVISGPPSASVLPSGENASPASSKVEWPRNAERPQLLLRQGVEPRLVPILGLHLEGPGP